MNRKPIVHQFIPSLTTRDAVSFHTLSVDAVLRELGMAASIYTARINAATKGRARHYRHHVKDPQPDLIIYQTSIGSTMVDYLMGREEPLILNYHNITPPKFVYRWNPSLGAALDYGRRQLTGLCRRANAAVADSEFNAAELEKLKCKRVEVIPVITDDAIFPSEQQQASRSEKDGSALTVLFVGRIAPNKCQHDLLAALAVLRQHITNVELVLVGASTSDRYEQALRSYATDLNIADVVRFEGSLSASELLARYRRADVFVSLSEHEGFGVPLVEAMAWGVPVIGFGAAAVPETLRGAGLVLDDKSPAVVAAAIQRVATDRLLRRHLVRLGSARANELRASVVRPQLHNFFKNLLKST